MDSYLQRLQDGITSATLGITAEDLHRHPEGKWSTAEVLEHLYLTYTGTVKGFTRCLEAGKPLASKPTGGGKGCGRLSSRNWDIFPMAGPLRREPTSERHGGREGPDGNWINHHTDGRVNQPVRGAVWQADQSAGPSRSGSAHHAAVAQISLGARTAPYETNTAAEGTRVITLLKKISRARPLCLHVLPIT